MLCHFRKTPLEIQYKKGDEWITCYWGNVFWNSFYAQILKEKSDSYRLVFKTNGKQILNFKELRVIENPH